MDFLEELASRRRFGMKPGLETICLLCRRLGDPQLGLPAIHVAGTNGKGAVCALLDAALREIGLSVGRYTSPHLVSLNERFFLDGRPVDDARLETACATVKAVSPDDTTFFEALTAAAFRLYADTRPDLTVFETGLGGRLDATNVCSPRLCVITRIGLDHCDWLGSTVEAIAAEKAGIIKPGVPIILGRNIVSVRQVVEARAREVGAPFYSAPDLASESEIPADLSLGGTFNRENAVTALAALKVLLTPGEVATAVRGFTRVVWPGRFQEVGRFIVDGAHNPPAARALADALDARLKGEKINLIAGFCGDKDVETVLRMLAPRVAHALAVRTNNPRSLSAAQTVEKMRACGMVAETCESLSAALARCADASRRTLVCGSLFLAGEALVALDAYPWGSAPRFDAAELLRTGAHVVGHSAPRSGSPFNNMGDFMGGPQSFAPR